MILIDFFKFVSTKFPELPESLKKANINDPSEEFIKKTLISAAYVAALVSFIIFLMVARYFSAGTVLLAVFGSLPFFLFFFFMYFLQLPKIKINKIDREISKEIVFAGRFLVVELESGVTLYDAMKNMAKSYPIVGAYFLEITNKVDIGTTIEDAVSESIELSPSAGLTKILWQISNSLRTGSDVSAPIRSVVETLIREQQIAVNEYARKLNPLAMFYMLIAIIIPSLGVTMLTIVSIFVGIKLSLGILLIIVGLIGFMQFMFIAMVNSIRPPVEL